MPRAARVQYEDARYHILNRGNYRKDLFLTHRTDQAFTEVMFEACESKGKKAKAKRQRQKGSVQLFMIFD